jgi:hypothetical protein
MQLVYLALSFAIASLPYPEDEVPSGFKQAVPDPLVVVDVVVVGRHNRHINCPAGYHFSNTCGEYGCNMNEGAGGSFIYLCLQKRKLSATTKFINEIQVNNKDCEGMLTTNYDLNRGAGGDYIYLCYLHNPALDVSAFSDLFVYVVGVNDLPPDYSCDPTSLNQGTTGKDIYLCYIRALDTPKEIIFSKLVMDWPNKTIQPSGDRDVVLLFENDNGLGATSISLTKSVEITLDNSYSWNADYEVSGAVKVKFSTAVPFISAAKGGIEFGVDFSNSNSTSGKITESRTTTIKLNCDAPPHRYYKCQAFTQNYSIAIPYTVLVRVKHYGDQPDKSHTVQGNFTSLTGSSIEFKKCCFRYCSEANYLCEDGSLGDTAQTCSSPIGQSSQPYTEEVHLEYDPELVVGLAVTVKWHAHTDCPSGYHRQMKGCPENGCDFNQLGQSWLGGFYIYLCQKKQRLSLITSHTLLVNDVYVAINHKSCNHLALIDDREYGNFNVLLYLCYGHSDSDLAPISDFYIHIPDYNEIPPGYSCCHTNLNRGTAGKAVYLCWARDYSAPRQIIVSSLVLDTANLRETQLGKPKIFDQMEVTGSTVKQEKRATVVLEKSWGKKFRWGGSVNVSMNINIIGRQIDASLSGAFKYAHGEEWRESTKLTITNGFECAAPEGKTSRCIVYQVDKEATVPYTATVQYINYDSTSRLTTIAGTFTRVSASLLVVKTCCVSACGANDIQCSEDQGCF